jgi:O-antigen ligase
VITQFTSPNSTHVATVSDRTADYDAVRPDLWSHFAFGRGYGSYDPLTYRVLDSEFLGQVVETGVLGLFAYVMIGVSVILATRKMIRRRHPQWSAPALCGAAAGVCLLIASGLYDAMGFPHGAFTFLYIAGLAVAVVAPGIDSVAPGRVRDHTFRSHPRPPLPSRAARERVLPVGGGR